MQLLSHDGEGLEILDFHTVSFWVTTLLFCSADEFTLNWYRILMLSGLVLINTGAKKLR
jgi:hypothetical protein